jgi:hypothetical protein
MEIADRGPSWSFSIGKGASSMVPFGKYLNFKLMAVP